MSLLKEIFAIHFSLFIDIFVYVNITENSPANKSARNKKKIRALIDWWEQKKSWLILRSLFGNSTLNDKWSANIFL